MIVEVGEPTAGEPTCSICGVCESWHPKTGCDKWTPAAPQPESPPQQDGATRDQIKGEAYLSAFISEVNADHSDMIPVPRSLGCYMRDEIERLIRAEAALMQAREALEWIDRLYESSTTDEDFGLSVRCWLQSRRAALAATRPAPETQREELP